MYGDKAYSNWLSPVSSNYEAFVKQQYCGKCVLKNKTPSLDDYDGWSDETNGYYDYERASGAIRDRRQYFKQ